MLLCLLCVACQKALCLCWGSWAWLRKLGQGRTCCSWVTLGSHLSTLSFASLMVACCVELLLCCQCYDQTQSSAFFYRWNSITLYHLLLWEAYLGFNLLDRYRPNQFRCLGSQCATSEEQICFSQFLNYSSSRHKCCTSCSPTSSAGSFPSDWLLLGGFWRRWIALCQPDCARFQSVWIARRLRLKCWIC